MLDPPKPALKLADKRLRFWARGHSHRGLGEHRSDESWHADLEMNLLSAVRFDRALVPGMVEQGSGVVVHVSSIASRLPQRTEASYAAATAALNTYSRELATEVGGHGVRVVCVRPGFIVTEGSFWHGLLGGSITRTGNHHFLRVDGFPALVIQRAAGDISPGLAAGRCPADARRPVHRRPCVRRQGGARIRRAPPAAGRRR
jgi:NAD(P)-dependent dehydrogenase (short-subunit alcohol dehydrogenase family)